MKIWTAIAYPTLQGSPHISRWLVAIGVLLVVLGLVAAATLLWATLALAYVLGAALLAGGILQLVHAVGMRKLAASQIWNLSGTIYVAAALPILLDPAFGATVLAVCVALALGVSGLSRVVIGLRDCQRGHGRTEMLISGIAALALTAIVVGLIWYYYAMWVLGLILAADLIGQGVAFLVIGLCHGSAAARSSQTDAQATG